MNMVYEEIDEFKEAYAKNDRKMMEDEFGDILCTVVSLGQVVEIDSEIVLNNNFDKIKGRIEKIENMLEEDEKIKDLTPDKFTEYWEKAKIMEK